MKNHKHALFIVILCLAGNFLSVLPRLSKRKVSPLNRLSPPAATVTSDVLPASCLGLAGIHFLHLGGRRLCVTGCVGFTGRVAKYDAGCREKCKLQLFT